MSYKICGQGPVTVPGCDSDSCEAIVAQAKVELREEFQASQEAQSEELKQFVGDSVSESDQSIRDDFASSQETQTNELMQAIADAVENDVDYNNVSNKPAVNGVTLQGDKTLEELGIYKVTPEQAAAAEQAQEILEESVNILDRVTALGRRQFSQTIVTGEEETSQVTFNPPGYVYGSNDSYSIYINGLRLSDDEYTREDNVVTLPEPITQAGQKIEIVVDTYPGLLDNAVRVDEDGYFYVNVEE